MEFIDQSYLNLEEKSSQLVLVLWYTVSGTEETEKFGRGNAEEQDIHKRIRTVVKTRINRRGIKCNEIDCKWYIEL